MSVRFPVECPRCQRRGEFAPGIVSCDCGSPYDPGLPPAPGDTPPGPGIWRHRSAVGALPREVTLGEGSTPLVSAGIGGDRVRLKLEHLSPTGSYKDRGAAYCLSLLASLGVRSVTEDSSGNAGAAYAAYAAALEICCRVFVPSEVPPAKLAAIRRHGAEVRRVSGGREATHLAARSSADYAGHSWAAPFLVGVGTIADEILEESGGTAPAEVICPVGGGGLITALHLAFRRLQRDGRLRSLPALTGAQARNCAPLCLAAERGGVTLPEITPRPTAADAVALERPVRWRGALAAVRETGGEWISVPEEEIRSAGRALAGIGHDVEPSSALAWAALRIRKREGGPGGETVLLLTGSGRKTPGPDTGKTA